MTSEKIQEEMAKYNWYHRIEVAPGVFTPGIQDYFRVCDFIRDNQAKHDYSGRSVLDVGARDCLHAIRTKGLGAGRVLAIDNDISAGARDFVLPLLALDIEYKHQNLFSLDDTETFDFVQCFGVLYHLRYPFNGLKKLVDAARP
jgi:tRNA (mo5U34)-methyltransferase